MHDIFRLCWCGGIAEAKDAMHARKWPLVLPMTFLPRTSLPHASHAYLKLYPQMRDLSSSSFNPKEQIQFVSICLVCQRAKCLFSWGVGWGWRWYNAWIKQYSIIQKWRLALLFHPKGHFACSSGPWCGWGNVSQVLVWASALDRLWYLDTFSSKTDIS